MNKSYNQQLVETRREKGLSLKEAAKGIGISRIHLFLLENGYFRPTKKTLEKIESFYQFNLDFSNNNEYPAPFHVFSDKKEKSPKKKILVTTILSIISTIFVIVGSSLFVSSVHNKTSHYGITYVEAREKAFKQGKNGRDIVTDLDYFYLENEDLTEIGKASISFYVTNSILYFNTMTFSSTTRAQSFSELGTGRYHFQIGGGLDRSSYLCTMTYGSSDAGLMFSCDMKFDGKPITKVSNLKVTTRGSVEITNELAVDIANIKINDLVNIFNKVLSDTLGRTVDFYKDFLSAREKGRVVNFAMQVVGLSLLIPGLAVLLFSLYILVQTLISRMKSLLLPLEEQTERKEQDKPLPKDLNINFGIPDYVILFISDIIGWLSFILLIFCVVGKLLFPLPEFLTSHEFLALLGIAYSFSPFLSQLIIFGSIKKERVLFYMIAKHFFVYLAVATFGTTFIGIAETWGYEVAEIVHNYIPGHIYLVTALNYILFLFLFFKPSFIKNKETYKTVLWRLLSLIPLGIIIAVIIVGNSYVLFYGVKKNVYVLLWFSNSKVVLSLVSVIFIYVSFFIKLHFHIKYGKSKAPLYYNGNRYVLINNIVCSAIVILMVIGDLFFINTEIGYYLGLGENLWILTMVPIVLLCKHGPNTIEISQADEELIKRQTYN